MSQPVLDFGNSLNWDLLLKQSYTASLSTTNPDYNYINPATFISDSNILAIGIKSADAKPYWWLGGRLSVQLLASPSSTSEFTAAMEIYRASIRLHNLGIVKFLEYTPKPYLCTLSFPYWLKSVDLEVWKYSGIQSTTVEDSLTRIETKIDSL